MRGRNVTQDTLFFSMTLEYLETYMPKQLGRSPQTIRPIATRSRFSAVFCLRKDKHQFGIFLSKNVRLRLCRILSYT